MGRLVAAADKRADESRPGEGWDRVRDRRRLRRLSLAADALHHRLISSGCASQDCPTTSSALDHRANHADLHSGCFGRGSTGCGSASGAFGQDAKALEVVFVVIFGQFQSGSRESTFYASTVIELETGADPLLLVADPRYRHLRTAGS